MMSDLPPPATAEENPWRVSSPAELLRSHLPDRRCTTRVVPAEIGVRVAAAIAAAEVEAARDESLSTNTP